MYPDRCQVSHCRFPTSHLTCAHRCGTCHRFGHGQIECGDPLAVERLQQRTVHDRFDDQNHCTVAACSAPWSHCSAAHHCGVCGSNAHSSRHCNSNNSSSGTNVDSGDGVTHAAQANVTVLTLKCPYCARENSVSTNQATAYGDSIADCVVCLESPAQVFLPACGHINLCWTCARTAADSQPLDND